MVRVDAGDSVYMARGLRALPRNGRTNKLARTRPLNTTSGHLLFGFALVCPLDVSPRPLCFEPCRPFPPNSTSRYEPKNRRHLTVSIPR